MVKKVLIFFKRHFLSDLFETVKYNEHHNHKILTCQLIHGKQFLVIFLTFAFFQFLCFCRNEGKCSNVHRLVEITQNFEIYCLSSLIKTGKSLW
jgi:hypothetical protein